jgi:hypothetical protein
MRLRYVLDENSCSRSLLGALLKHNSASGAVPVDFVYIGGPDARPKGTPDLDLVRWAADHGRLIVSRDRKTLVAAHSQHVNAGNATLGLIILRRRFTTAEIVDWLDLLSEEDPASFASSAQFLPL